MKALLTALKQLDENGGPAVYLALGDIRYDFICYGDGTFAVRQGSFALMSPTFKLNWVSVKKALAWIDTENEAAIRSRMAASFETATH